MTQLPFTSVADYNNMVHSRAIIALMNDYITDPMGGGCPYGEERGAQLISAFLETSNAITFLISLNDQYIGLANCFLSLATFRITKCLNIHDFIVKKSFRDKGLGKFLMRDIITWCLKTSVGKVTLEVRNDNPVAQSLYRSMGFGECSPPMHFWVRELE